MSDLPSFDLDAAGLRADGRDLTVGVDVLAAKLEADIGGVEAGGIPLRGEQRLGGVGAGGTPFTAGVSGGGFALGRPGAGRAGGQVMGSSVYKGGWQSYPWAAWTSDSTATELRQL